MRCASLCWLLVVELVAVCGTTDVTRAQVVADATVQPRYADASPVALPPVQPVNQGLQQPAVGAPAVGAAPNAAQPTGAAPAQYVPMGPPFQITPVEQQFVDQILQMWENESAKINTFSSRFERWEYDPVFGPGTEIPMIKSVGQLTYSKPDKGSFKIAEIRRYQPKNPQAAPVEGDWVLQKEEVGEHWVCDGKAVFEYKHDKKQLVVQPLPPELQGKSIVDGPLPFLFGAEAEKLKRRYWIRSKESGPATIWLEAYPRTQADAANYHHVEIMLERKTMQPKAIQVHMPNNKSRAVYMFDQPTINGKLNALLGGIFSAPRTPFGWTKVVEPLPSAQPPNPQAANPQPGTATR